MKSMPCFFLIDLFVVTDLVFFKRRIGIGHLGNRYRRVGFLVDFDIYTYFLLVMKMGDLFVWFFFVLCIYIYISV